MRHSFAVAALLALLASPALAQDPAPAAEVAAAREMLEASRSHENFVRSLELGFEQNVADLTPAMRTVMYDFMAEHFRYEDMEPEFIRIYTELFTEEELRSFTAFYNTPAGQRMAELTPELQSAMQQTANQRLQALMPELMQRMMAAMAEEEDGGP